MEYNKSWENQTSRVKMDYLKKSKNWKRNCTEPLGCVLTPLPLQPSVFSLGVSGNTLKVNMVTQHLVDLRAYPVESHADLLVYFQESLSEHDFRPEAGDVILTIISRMQERSLSLELASQLAERQEFALIPVLKLQGVCGHPVEVRE